MPNSYSRNSSTPNQPNAHTEALPWVREVVSTPKIQDSTPAKADDATEVLALTNGYEYVTKDNESHRAVIDDEDNSLSLGIMKNGEEVERLTRQERRADRFAEPQATVEQARTEVIRQPTTQGIAIERDALEPAALRVRKTRSSGIGSKIFFIGSALVTAIAAIITVMLLLPSQDGTSQPASGTSATPDGTSSSVQSTDSPATSAPSFNTQVPTVTEEDGQSALPVAPGTVQYAPPQAPPDGVAEDSLPEPAIPIEVAPTVGEELPAEPSVPSAGPPEITPPTDSSPNDEPERPVETAEPGEDTGGNTGAMIDEPVAPSIAPVAAPTAMALPSEPAAVRLP